MTIASVVLSPSETWLAWLVWIGFAACVGGAFIFIGLLLETLAEKDKFPSVDNFRKWKRRKRCGEILVLIGVFIEIVSTGTFAIRGEFESRQTNNRIKIADPRNLPIVSIIGRVCLVVQPPFRTFASNLNLPKRDGDPKSYAGSDRLPSSLPFLLSDDKELQKHETVFFQFGKRPGEDFDSEIPFLGQVSAMVDLVGVSITNVDNIGFEINLYPPADNAPVFNPNSVTFNNLKYLHFSLNNELPPPLKVVVVR